MPEGIDASSARRHQLTVMVVSRQLRAWLHDLHRAG